MNIPVWSDITYQKDGVEKINFQKLKMLLKQCATEVQPYEICKDAVKHFTLFHDKTPNDKYISFFFSGKNQKFQLNYTKKAVSTALLSSLVAFSNLHELNLYLSEFCYLTGLNRKESNVFSTNVITMDLDKKDLDINKELPKIQELCKNNGLALSAVFSSGRGHYLVFNLNDAYVCVNNTVKLQQWKYNYDLICDIFKEYGADYKCKDISRVFRLMGSYNYKDDTKYKTQVVQTWNTSNDYSLIPCCKETIEQKLFEKKIPGDCENNGRIPKRKRTVKIDENIDYITLSENKSFKFQNKKRLNDLLKLLSLRYDHLGDRHVFLYIIVSQLNVSGYSFKDALSFILEKVNPKFSLPESEYEIVRQLHSVYSENKIKQETINNKTIEYISNGYHSGTTQWIIDTLKISEEEQRKLSVLKSKDLITQLRQEKRLARSRCHTQNKKESEKKMFNEYAQTHSVPMIVEKTNISTSSVYRKLDQTPKQIQMEKENALILQLKNKGLSIAEISQEVGLTLATVKKRLQKIYKEQKEIINVETVVSEEVVNNNEQIVSNVVDNDAKQIQSFNELIKPDSILNTNSDPPDNFDILAELPW